MVRHYKRKKTGMNWTDEDMEKAIEYAETNNNVKEASRRHGIPRSTLRDHIGRRVPVPVRKGRKAGHPTTLTAQQEQEIVDTAIMFANWGFGLGSREVKGIVASYFKATKTRNPFLNDCPGEGWWSRFMKSHPMIVKRKPQQMQLVRARATNEEIISHWFEGCLKPALQELDLFDKPEHIFNVDESGFSLAWTPRTILARRGQKSPQALVAGSGREYVTVQVCVSASGRLLPPYVVYKGKRLIADTTYGGPLGSRFTVTPNGWMDEATFINWMRTLFIPSLPAERPILLILDGHSSHISYEVRVLAIENQIHLLKLPAHTTHVLQPLDVGVFNHKKRL